MEGMSAFYLTVWDSQGGKFNENTSEGLGERLLDPRHPPPPPPPPSELNSD